MDLELHRATRKLLFGGQSAANDSVTREMPGAGTSAARIPSRHTRVKITINLDGDIIDRFKERGDEEGTGYQFLINQALREYLDGTKTERIAREVGQLLLDDPSFLEILAEKLPLKEPTLSRVK